MVTLRVTEPGEQTVVGPEAVTVGDGGEQPMVMHPAEYSGSVLSFEAVPPNVPLLLLGE